MKGHSCLESEPTGDILVVDDSVTSRTWARLCLNRAGYHVREAEVASEALAAIAEQPPDLVLLDVILPDMDGFAVTRRLREDAALASIPIVLVTTLGDRESKVRGLEAGANDFLTKPPDEAELLARVRTLLRLKQNQEELLAERNKTALLYRVSRELSTELELDALLSRILELTVEAVGALRGSIILLDERGGVVRNIFSYQGEVSSVTDQVRGQIVQKGLAGWVIEHREGVLIYDAPQDSRWVPFEQAHAEVRSVLSTPLLHQDRVTGVLTLTDEEEGRFTAEHLDLLDSIASQAAVVIEKARVYLREQRWARKLQFVHGVGHHVTSLLDPDRILEEVTWLIGQTFDFYHVELALLEGEDLAFSNWRWGREGGGGKSPQPIRLTDQGIIPWVAGQGRSLWVADVKEDARYRFDPELPDTVSELAVPLQAGGRILGVLDVQSDRYGQLTREDLPLMEILAAQITVALINAQLFAEVERERGRLSAILTGTADAVVAIDRAGHVTLVNPAAERAFGVAADRVIGRPLAEAIDQEGLARAFQDAQEAADTAPRAELALADGRTLLCSVSPIAAGSQREEGWVSIMRDITHLKELDEMKSEFVATVSHDLRSPLTTIRGYAEMLLSAQKDEEHRSYLRHIGSSAQQMAELVEDLLNLGKIEAGVEADYGPCRLELIVEEAVESAGFQAQLREIALSAQLEAVSAPVLADPQQLRQVLDNLLSNALKYTPAGGTVTVRLQEREGQVVVSVQDDGIGIPPEAIPRVFEKFYRVPTAEVEDIPGTGLGLAIAKAIVEKHGGKIWVESAPGEGADFCLFLPLDGEGSGRPPSRAD